MISQENDVESEHGSSNDGILRSEMAPVIGANARLAAASGSDGGSKSLQSSPTAGTHASQFCAFCKSNGEPRSFYTSHSLRNTRGKVNCPVLYVYVCPICGSTGENSHTLRYCPFNTSDSLSITCITKSIRSAAGLRTKASKNVVK